MKSQLKTAFWLAFCLVLLLLEHANAMVTVNVLPGNLTAPVGENVALQASVTATAGETVMSYQWFMSTNNQNFTLVGNTATLVFKNIQTSKSGYYFAAVTYASGGPQQTVSSPTVQITVGVSPAILVQPMSMAQTAGSNAVFSVTVDGTLPLQFQWRHDGTNLMDDTRISGSANTNLDLEDLMPADAGDYDIIVTNLFGSTTSHMASLVVLALPPVITSVTNAAGIQGQPFTYTIIATNFPDAFSADPLPDGLTVDATSGVISGVPLVSGTFVITLGATNVYGADTNTLNLTLAPGAPVITSTLTRNGKQGQSFSYTITATNSPTSFSATPLPDGLNLNAASGVISGIPLVSGSFPVTIGAINAFGVGSQTLTLTLASAVPSITSSLTATGTENQTDFRYTIRANNSPTTFWVSDLPTGLMVNTNTGAITGITLYAGHYSIPLFAANAWGVGTATLQLTVNNMPINDLVIADLTTNYLSPYLLEFGFTLRDGTDPTTSHAVVASPTLMTASAYEDDNPVSPSETAVILQRVGTQGTKVVKGYLVLDFTESIASPTYGLDSNGIPAAVAAEVAAAQNFVNQQPPDTQIGVYEFHRDDEAPQQVVPLTTDKALLNNAIAGIWTNYVQGFPAGSRAWDALGDAVNALGAANSDEVHYIVLMSDGNDESSTNTTDGVISAANNANVQINAVGFGEELNVTPLQNIASSTSGRYYTASNLSELSLNFALIGKDLSSEYFLRWATLNRSSTPFMPSFQIKYQGITAYSPPNPVYSSITNIPVLTNGIPLTNNGVAVTTNITVYTTNFIISPYNPSEHAGNILGGTLRLVSDADVNPAGITLRSTYAPRYIRQLLLHYRANWPVTLSLNSTNPGEILSGWTLTQTNDGSGGEWTLLSAPDPSNLTESIPFAACGDLLTFSFRDPISATNAFSLFAVDNSIYTNTINTDFYGFNVSNASGFITYYDPPPPHGTPVPWLIGYGFTTNFADAELLDPNGNGLQVWQDYLAGLDPLDTNSIFNTYYVPLSKPPKISFNTVVARNYRIEWAASLDGTWTVLRDGIPGTGGVVTFTDLRNLSTVNGMFYRVSVEYP
ncbi:MAG TPA: putative Ig domain-containing protein [Verrucomicrobiae bacterium]|nr:putative Ig domain-containing protein [Verrucomicrobiae bacterium]